MGLGPSPDVTLAAARIDRDKWAAVVRAGGDPIGRHAPDGVTISHHVHDELVLAAPPEQTQAASALLRQAFLHALNAVFPDAPAAGLVDVTVGSSWDELKK